MNHYIVTLQRLANDSQEFEMEALSLTDAFKQVKSEVNEHTSVYIRHILPHTEICHDERS